MKTKSKAKPKVPLNSKRHVDMLQELLDFDPDIRGTGRFYESEIDFIERLHNSRNIKWDWNKRRSLENLWYKYL